MDCMAEECKEHEVSALPGSARPGERESADKDYEAREVPVLPSSALLNTLSKLWTYPMSGVDEYKRALSGLERMFDVEVTGKRVRNEDEQTRKVALQAKQHAQRELTEELDKLSRAFEEYDTPHETIEGSTAFQLDYTRLFIGSLKMYAPPYASYYIDGDSLLYGPTAAEIENLYAQFGLEIKKDEHDMPDHIRFLLAFLAVLAQGYEKGGERDFALAYADFKSEYFSSWVGDFKQKICESTEYSYFKVLIDFTIKMV